MRFLEAAQELASLRKAWAMDFLIFRAVHTDTDNKARAMADEKHIEALTMAEARYELAKWRLHHGAAETTPASRPDHEPQQGTADQEGDGQDCGD